MEKAKELRKNGRFCRQSVYDAILNFIIVPQWIGREDEID